MKNYVKEQLGSAGFSNKIPDFIVHYSRGEPFRSITAIPHEERSKVLAGLNDDNIWGLARYRDPVYLQSRLKVEEKLRKAFIEKGGQPVLTHPVYCFLGRHAAFEEHSKNRGFKIALDELPLNSVSFTLGDSMFGFDPELRLSQGEKYSSPLCGQVFKASELKDLIAGSRELHIEAQLWITIAESSWERLSRSSSHSI